jgi:hypothetical protein
MEPMCDILRYAPSIVHVVAIFAVTSIVIDTSLANKGSLTWLHGSSGARESVSQPEIIAARLNARHDPNVVAGLFQPRRLPDGFPMASVESQEYTVLKDAFYDVSAHIFAFVCSAVRTTRPTPVTFLQIMNRRAAD